MVTRNWMKTSLLALGLAALCASAQETYSTWPSVRQVIVNTTSASGGANVPGSVTNFPLLVRLNANQTDVFATAGTNAATVRFTTSDGVTRLKHQLESWDSAGKKAAFWVMVPSVNGNGTTRIRMYWGKVGAADSSNSAAVFDTSKGFQAVFHMSEATNDTLRDATGNKFKAVPAIVGTGAVPTDTTGFIGRGKLFAGNTGTTAAGGYYSVLNSAAGKLNFAVDTTYTLSAWAYVDTLNLQNQYRIIVSKSDFQYNLMKNNSTAGQWEFNPFVAGPTAGWERNIGTPVTQRAWQHVMGVRYANGVDSIFVDGVAPTTAITYSTSGTARQDTFEVRIGRRSDVTTSTTAGNNRLFRGILDEVRLQSVARSYNWAKLEYETQKDTSTAVTIGAAGVVAIERAHEQVGDQSFVIRGNGASFTFALPAGEGLRVSVADLQGREVWSRSAAGKNELVWDGRGTRGERLTTGVYLARVTARVNGVETAVAQRTFSMVK